MTPTIHADPVPLRVEETGAIRVGDTRVLLDIVIESFKQGNAAEVIAHQFPTLQLADVYAVIAYYLRHRQEVDEYLDRRDKEADELQKVIQANQRPGPTKEELLRRRSRMQRDHMAQLLAEMQRDSIVLPPGCPTTTEMLREDRAR